MMGLVDSENQNNAEFVARQPIFNHQERVFGYELLFRSSSINACDAADGDQASCHVADHLLTLGQSLTQGRNAFINCTRSFLVNDYVTLLPSSSTVVEILEDVEPDEEVLSACRRLKKAGYLIALDDVISADNSTPFLDLADIVKVDFLQTNSEERTNLRRRFASSGVRMLAEKVETRDDFDHAVKLGYQYFQGYFFCEPQMVRGRRIPFFKPHYLRILQAITQPELDFKELEELIHREVSLCYKLMHYANSAIFGFRTEIRSVRHALALLGEKEVRKLVLLITTLSLAIDKPPELIITSLTRARSCELLAFLMNNGRQRSSTFFLMGLFSVMDALLDQPMNDVLEQIALPHEVKTALLGGENFMHDVYEIVLSYERANWDALSQRAAKIGLKEGPIPDAYLHAVDWAKKVFDVSPRQ